MVTMSKDGRMDAGAAPAPCVIATAVSSGAVPKVLPPPRHPHDGTSPPKTAPWWDPSPYIGPLMINAMRKFMSAMNSCRSGYGRSSSVLLGGDRGGSHGGTGSS